MSTDHEIENEIQAKGKTAPRITPADVEAAIAGVYYFTAEDGAHAAFQDGEGDPPLYGGPLSLLTFCVLVLRNGFTVTGESACADPAMFDADIRRDLARLDAERKVWPLLGYALRTELSRPVLTEADAAADLAGEPRPDQSTSSLFG